MGKNIDVHWYSQHRSKDSLGMHVHLSLSLSSENPCQTLHQSCPTLGFTYSDMQRKPCLDPSPVRAFF